MCTDVPDLLTVSSETHTRVLTALDDPEHDGLVAVAWCSAHLAAVDQVLYAALQRLVPGGARDELHLMRLLDHRLQQAVCRLDRRLTGDAHLVNVSFQRLADDVRDALLAHADQEARLVRVLQALLTPAEQWELAEALPAATVAAPTRPHPHTPHTPLAGLVARIDAGVDRIRDVMDNRVPQLGRRTRPARPMSRWGAYFTGSPYPQEPTALPVERAER